MFTLYIYLVMHCNVNDATYIVNWLGDGTDYTCEYRNG